MTVAASPAGSAETVIAAISGMQITPGDAVDLAGNVSITIGTSGVSVVLKVERGAVAGGTLVAATPAITVVAANVYNLDINCTDIQVPEVYNQGYVFTVTVASAAATSTVGSVWLGAVW
jgi:hypothetical protein